MKKFFGLKMTLAALAVVSFASCSDSDSGDVIIPNSQSVELPDPVYVVSGTVTDFETAGTVKSVSVKGGGLDETTDANGFFEKVFTSPVTTATDVDFTLDGYFKTTRTLKMAALEKGQGNASYIFNVAMVPTTSDAGLIAGTKVEDIEGEEKEPVPAEAEMVSIDDPLTLLALGLTADDLVNDADSPVDVVFDATALGLPYGVIAAASKDDGKDLFIKWAMAAYHNDPFDGYGIYEGLLRITIPAKTMVTKFSVTPWRIKKNVVFALSDGDYEQAVELIEEYVTKIEASESTEHDHGHGHGNGNNAGGGENVAP